MNTPIKFDDPERLLWNLLWSFKRLLKFMFSKTATTIWRNLQVSLDVTTYTYSQIKNWEILSNFRGLLRKKSFSKFGEPFSFCNKIHTFSGSFQKTKEYMIYVILSVMVTIRYPRKRVFGQFGSNWVHNYLFAQTCLKLHNLSMLKGGNQA